MSQRILKYVLIIVAACFLLSACNIQDNRMDAKSVEEGGETSEQKIEDENMSGETSEQKIEDENMSEEISEPEIVEIDLSSYFGEHSASAVFYNAESKIYEIYNLMDAQEQRSPCSTFKIVSTLAALEYGIITVDNSLREWSGEQFWNAAWNADITLEEAFKKSCVWYYREIINEIGQVKMQTFIDELGYGNQNISDWEGSLNQNNSNRALTGFWVESSLLISPIEQVEMLNRVFGDEAGYNFENVQTLKNIMKVEQDTTKIEVYGKTGYGKLNNVSLDSWFTGMFESNSESTYFAVHLSETEDPDVSSALAKEIALQIIADKYVK